MRLSDTIRLFRSSSLPHFADDARAHGLDQVLDWLVLENPQQLTLNDIAQVAGFDETDAITSALWVATVLSTGPVPILDLGYVFRDEEGCEHVIPPQPGMNDGTGIVHPVTGLLTADWAERTSLQFTPVKAEPEFSPAPQ